MEKITTVMKRILADSYAVYLKTQNYHWNVTSHHAFHSLHKLFDEQYKELAKAIDVIAEHIRQMKSLVPASFTDFQVLTEIEDGDECFSADQMLKDLAEDQNKLIVTINKGIELASNLKDEATNDLLIDRLRAHKNNKWMLESSLPDDAISEEESKKGIAE